MAPEIVRQQPYGFAVDIWGVGCLAIELACGAPPYHDDGKLMVHSLGSKPFISMEVDSCAGVLLLRKSRLYTIRVNTFD